MARPAAVGHLIDIGGRVEIERRGQALRKGALLDTLQAGDRVRVAAGGTAQLVLYANGARFALTGPAGVEVAATRLLPRSGTPPQARRALSLEFVRRINRPISPPDARLTTVQGLILRGDDALGPQQPNPSGTVRSTPVTLRWAGPIHADQLHLQITDGQRTVHAANQPSAARSYPVPEGVLQPGKYYFWFVTAVQDGQSQQSCGALLRVLTLDERSELERLERELGVAAAPSLPDTPPPTPADPAARKEEERIPALLLLGAVYERLGMRAAARWAYEEVHRARPEDAGVRSALRRLTGPDTLP